MTQNTNIFQFNQYRLGLWYSTYRFIIATSLLVIFLLTNQRFNTDYHYPQLYFYVLIGYVLASCVQLITLKSIRVKIYRQLP